MDHVLDMKTMLYRLEALNEEKSTTCDHDFPLQSHVMQYDNQSSSEARFCQTIICPYFRFCTRLTCIQTELKSN